MDDGLFDDKARRADGHGIFHIGIVAVCGKNNHFRGGRDFEDLFGGAGGFSDFFRTIFGDAVRSSMRNQQQVASQQGYEQELQITFDEAYSGAMRQLQMSNGHKLNVRIPAGVKTGSKVRVANAAPDGSDLYLISANNEPDYLPSVMDGAIEPVIQALVETDQAEKLSASGTAA